MSDGLLIDTHIALWLDSGNDQLKPATRDLIDRCWRKGGSIFLSAVSAWEIAVLVDRGHIQLDLPLQEHRDPGDRLLIASAIELGCPLVTYDDRIRTFGRQRGREYGFTLGE
jgi:PIN domain nuclease of toxin-antitoxin system